MKSSTRLIQCFLVLLFAATSLLAENVNSEEPRKAIVLAWDGTVPALVKDMLRQGKLPNLAALIKGGSFADKVIPAFPSFTAPGFASLWSGAPTRITGISGNRVLRMPRNEFTILHTGNAFSAALLRADTLWASAERTGRKVVLVHAPLGRSDHGVDFQGYAGIAGSDGIVNAQIAKPKPAAGWQHPAASAAPPLEFTFTIAGANFYGLLIDDPSDRRNGYDTLLVADRRDGNSIRAKLSEAPAGSGGELLWSPPLQFTTAGGRRAVSYLRLFQLQSDGRDFLLYFTRPAREVFSRPELIEGASATARAFIGDGAKQLYAQGALGPTLPNGGDGTAEARYLETVEKVQRQLLETNRWAIEHLPWDLFIAYTPYPDEAEHLWYGFLQPDLPGYRSDIADRLRLFLENVYRTSDELLGMLMRHRTKNTIIALISDHGMEATSRFVAINKALREGGLLALDDRGRVNLAKTKAFYPALNGGYIVINSTDRKSGIVPPQERDEVARRVRELLAQISDRGRPVVASVYDAQNRGEALGIGGEAGGDLYVDLLPGYGFDARLSAVQMVAERQPRGMHGFNPQRATMRTIMVLNGPGIRAGQKLRDVRLIDFAPTLARLLDLPPPRQATGRVLDQALAPSR